MALRKEVSLTTPPLLSKGTPILHSPRVRAMRPPKRPTCKGGTWGTPPIVHTAAANLSPIGLLSSRGLR
jgi:hypothetical protein